MISELLGDPLVKALTGLAILPVILLAVLVGVVVFLMAITRARPDIEAQEPLKYQRYEAGNPPKGEARGKVSMQYLGYLIVFLAVEPAVILLAILLAAPQALAGKLLAVLGVFIAVYAPLLAYSIAESKRVESWMLEG